MTDVRSAPALAGLALAGLFIAVLGAYVPARRAARLPVAEVLHDQRGTRGRPTSGRAPPYAGRA